MRAERADRENNPAWSASLVHLAGGRRGVTEQLQLDRVTIGSDTDAVIRVPGRAGSTPAGHHATLTRRGSTYEVTVVPDHEVWVNGEQVDHLVLASGDVIEVGRGGPVLRFRLYPPGRGPFKTIDEAFSDCWDCARYESGGALKKVGVFLTGVPHEIAFQTSRTFRLSVVGVLGLLALSTGYLVVRTARVERSLSRQEEEVHGLAGLLGRSGPNPATDEDTRRMLNDLRASLSATERRVEELESRDGAAARVISWATQSTIFLQGAYGFVSAKSGKPMRLVVGPEGRPTPGPDGQPGVTTEGAGAVVELLYTGTGFVVGENGLIITNRHVGRPWEADPDAGQVIAQGWRPVLRRLVGFLPGVPRPFNVTVLAASESADIALLQCDAAAGSVPPLPVRLEPPKPGEEVLVLGYPLGIEAILARADAGALKDLQAADHLDFWSVAERLSASGQIRPLTSRGIVGQVTDRAVTYDAATTHGGSGGPVLTLQGEVVAVNAAILKEYGGSNLGVPAAQIVQLLDRQARVRKPAPK